MIGDEWVALMGQPNVASREYIYRHYDSEVQAAPSCARARPTPA